MSAVEYPSGQDVDVIVTLTGLGTNEPDSAQWWVEDADGTVLVERAVVPGSRLAAGSVQLLVPASINAVPSGTTRVLRLVRVRWRYSDLFAGEREDEAHYVVVPSEPLILQTNSFLTYGESLLLASETADMAAFEGATREDRIRCLAEAWRSLVRLRFCVPLGENGQTRIVDFPGADPGNLIELSAEEFLALDPKFRDAIRRAQVIEANERLNTSVTPDLQRTAGLLSSTVGEVSQMYRSGKPLKMTISKRAIEALRGYLVHSIRLTRGA